MKILRRSNFRFVQESMEVRKNKKETCAFLRDRYEELDKECRKLAKECNCLAIMIRNNSA